MHPFSRAGKVRINSKLSSVQQLTSILSSPARCRHNEFEDHRVRSSDICAVALVL